MTRDEAIERIKRGCGFRTDTEQDEAYAAALREAQRLLENGRTLPFFLVEHDDPLTVAAGTAAVSLPTGFIREYDDENRETLRYYDEDAEAYVFLEKLEANAALQRFAGVDAGTPQAYVLRKSDILVYPERDAEYTLTWSYYKRGDTLSSNIENVWLEEEFGAPEVLIGKAGMAMATDLRDKDAMAMFNRMYIEAWQGAIAQGILRQEANRPNYVGGDL